MNILLKLTTGIILAFGSLLWFLFLMQLYEKIVHPEQKNANGEELFFIGLVLTFLTALAYLGLRSAQNSQQKRNHEAQSNT